MLHVVADDSFQGPTENAGHFLQLAMKVIARLLLSAFEHRAERDVDHERHCERLGEDVQSNSGKPRSSPPLSRERHPGVVLSAPHARWVFDTNFGLPGTDACIENWLEHSVGPTGASKRHAIFRHCTETDARNDDQGRDDKRGKVLVQSVAFPTTSRVFVFRDGNLGLLDRGHC